VFCAACGIRRDWVMADSMKNPHHTTDWQQLLRVKA
jgi:Domain of unknown function (DUF4113)